MNFNLLRPFDLEAAKRGEEICWHTGGPIEFIASGTDDECAYRSADGNLYIANSSLFRMHPLTWVEEKPVYKGDVLYYTDPNFNQTIEVIGMNPRDGGKGIEGNVSHADKPLPNTGTAWAPIERWTWTKPEPVKKTITVKFLGYMRGDGRLVLLDESKRVLYKRVPSEDKTCEVEE